jgi:hypothetical protein
MSAVISIQDFAAAANLTEFSAPQPISVFTADCAIPSDSPIDISGRISESSQDLTLSIEVIGFDFGLSLPVSEKQVLIEPHGLALRARIDENVTFVLTLTGDLSGLDDDLRVELVQGVIETTDPGARSGFVVSTILALFNSADGVVFTVPEMGFQLQHEFKSLSLKDVSETLQHRQIFFRTLVIEQAVGIEIRLPEVVPGPEVSTLALIFFAIVARSFDWPIKCIEMEYSANDTSYEQLTSLTRQESITVGPVPVHKILLGTEINLGNGFISIQNPTVPGHDQLCKEFAKNDDHPVQVYICSQSGHGHYDLPEAPRLPDFPWTRFLEALIDLDESLSRKLADKYIALAAATLDGLTEEEKVAVTARPYLDPVAFSD